MRLNAKSFGSDFPIFADAFIILRSILDFSSPETMKYCPNCRTQYTDDTLKFCLQDGSPLADAHASEMRTANYGEAETVISNRPPSRISIDYQTAETEIRPPQTTNPAAQIAAPKKSRTALIVALTAFVSLLVLSGIGIGAWLYYKNQRTEIAQNNNSGGSVNAANQNAVKNTNSANVNKKTPSPTPKNSPNTNAADILNANAAQLPPAQIAQIKKEIGAAIDGWKAAGEAQNLDAQMDKYADKVDYYNKKDADIDFVRSDRERAFSQFDSVNMTISNLTITPGADARHATAVFDKEWIFEGEEKTSTGKVKTQLQFENDGGEWLIVGEKDLKLYYKD